MLTTVDFLQGSTSPAPDSSTWIRRWMRWLTERPKPVLWLRAVLLLACAAWLDIATGLQVSVFAFYFVPLFIAAFLIGPRAGITIAVLSAVIRLYANFIYPNYMLDQSIGMFLVPTWNFLVDLISFLIFAFLFASVREQLNRENLLARRDPLTKAYNLRAFTEAVLVEMDRCHRHGTPFTLVYMDLDNFKAVNDTLGHEAGDELLRIVVKTMEDELRGLDIVARLGGDEFAILMPQSSVEGGELAMQRLREFLGREMRARNWPVTFSAGAVTHMCAPDSFEEALKQSDTLMYSAKKNGKNQYLHEAKGTPVKPASAAGLRAPAPAARANGAGKTVV